MSELTAQMMDPREIEIETSTSPLHIVWEDDEESVYELEFLRRRCTCAHCTHYGLTSLEERMSRPIPSLGFEVRAMHPVGNYAINIEWKDGHNAGIYTFRYLREIAEESREFRRFEV